MNIGLCLSGGGIKGAAHIGVIKALEEKGIKISMISGTSSGSIVASLYAMGYSTDDIYIIFKKYAKKIRYVDFKNILKLIFGIFFKNKIIINGLTSGKNLEKIIDEKCNESNLYNISDIKIPLFISSVNLQDGNTYVFSNNNCARNSSNIIINDIPLSKAVRASCSFPRNFRTFKMESI